jgi:predicted nucleic acid-binding Zn ribbon protein
MDAIRDVLRTGLKRSLGSLSPADRLSAAWLVVCGAVLAEHGKIVGYTDGRVEVEADGGAWMEQFRSMRRELEVELSRVAGLPVTGIHFQVKR